jgi:hypothetical protein
MTTALTATAIPTTTTTAKRTTKQPRDARDRVADRSEAAAKRHLERMFVAKKGKENVPSWQISLWNKQKKKKRVTDGKKTLTKPAPQAPATKPVPPATKPAVTESKANTKPKNPPTVPSRRTVASQRRAPGGKSEPPPLRTNDANRCHQEIIKIYEQFNPSKLANLDGLFKKYRGKEQALLRAIEKKYEDQSLLRAIENTAKELEAAAKAQEQKESAYSYSVDEALPSNVTKDEESGNCLSYATAQKCGIACGKNQDVWYSMDDGRRGSMDDEGCVTWIDDDESNLNGKRASLPKAVSPLSVLSLSLRRSFFC